MNRRLLGLMFVLIAAAFVARTLYFSDTVPLIADTDDAMRIVEVHDLLAGQGWFDLVQHRLNTPYGAELHWSRLADLPLAAALLILRPVLGGAAETVAAYIVPLGLLLLLLYLSGRVALKLAGPESLLPAFALPAFSLTVLGEFVPGRLDHHALQLLLLMAMLWCCLEAMARPRFAIGAGFAAATSLALGIEGLPSILAVAAAFGLLWVMSPERADALRGFGVSLAAAAAAHLALALPPDRWFVPACDAISVVYVAGAIGVGAVFAALSVLPLANRPAAFRVAAGGLAAVLLLALLAVSFPQCMGGPYAALDPWLVANWIDKITEAAPFITSLLSDPVYPVAVGVPTALALAVGVTRLLRSTGTERAAWAIYLVFLAFAVITMLVQIRGSRMASVLAVPACAALIVMARHAYLRRQSIASTGGLVLSWLGSAGIAIALGASLLVNAVPGLASPSGDTSGLDKRQCLMPAAFTDLAALPPERIMTPIDLGSHMLLFTPHSVVAAPYHRNQAGLMDAFRFFNGPIEAARAILEARGIGLVVTCPAMPEMGGLPDAAPDSFVRLAAAGTLPAWLVDRSLAGAPLRVYAVLPRD